MPERELQWFVVTQRGVETTAELLSMLSDRDVPSEDIKVVVNGTNEWFTIFYRHTKDLFP